MKFGPTVRLRVRFRGRSSSTPMELSPPPPAVTSAATNSDPYRTSSAADSATATTTHPRRYGLHFSASNFFHSPLSALLDYSGLLLRPRSTHHDSDALINSGYRDHIPQNDPAVSVSGNAGEVSIRIIGAAEQDHDGLGTVLSSSAVVGQLRDGTVQNEVFSRPISRSVSASSVLDVEGDYRSDRGSGEGVSQGVDAEAADGIGVNSRDSSYQRYDIQQAARWIEQVLPFSLLLLVVFIRQHFQGFFVTIWIAAILLKSNDILRKQTALKMRWFVKLQWFLSVSFSCITRTAGAEIIVSRSGIMDDAGSRVKLLGQMLTLVEYLILLYRALLPAPVWYCFFLNKEYGSLFSSLMTGLYLTFKLTSVVEKVQYFFAALKALSRQEIHYGAYATSEQVSAAGDLCAICQEKIHGPILLRCKHIFCEECVSEWFERERTCPLCRALVKPADIRSFGDGSTSLFFQLF